MSFPNRYKATCAGCSATVAPSSLAVINGRTSFKDGVYVTYCVACDAERESRATPAPVLSVKPKVRIVPDSKPNTIICTAITYLGEAVFAAFKLACHRAGARYEINKETRRAVNRAPLAALPQMVNYLRDAGMDIELDAGLAAMLQARADQARQAAHEADLRIAKISAELAQRTNPVTGKPEALLPFQPHGILTLAEHSPGGFALCDDMGLGKTVQVLLALRQESPVVVLTRASIVSEWIEAVRRWTPARGVASYEGRGGLTYWPAPGQVLAGSYEVIPEPEAIPDNVPEGLVVIVDEAHNFKGSGNQRDRKWRKLRDKVLAAKGTIYVLTGTPMVNDDLDELWTVLQVANLGVREFGTKARFNKLAQNDRPEFYRRLKNVMLRRIKTEVLPFLPPITYTTITCDITDEIRSQLDDALAKVVELAIARAEEEARKAGLDEAGINRKRLEAAANVNGAIDLVFDGSVRPPFEMISRVKSILALAKLPRSLEKLDELEEQAVRDGELWRNPILFFSAHVEPARTVAKRPFWGCITGDTAPDDRVTFRQAFQAGRLAGGSMTIRAGGEGLNLTRCDKIVRNDREWTPGANEQASARAWRFGQNNPVQVFDFIANHPLDQRISERLAEKESFIGETVEMAVTRLHEKRESLAERLEATLDSTQEALGGLPAARVRRPPQTEEERLSIGWARTSGVETYVSITRQFDRHQALSDPQWKLLTRAREDALDALKPHKPRGPVQAWTYRSLLLLARYTVDPSLRIDGPIRPDVAKVKALADAARTTGLTDQGWEDARKLLQRYQRQVGEQP